MEDCIPIRHSDVYTNRITRLMLFLDELGMELDDELCGSTGKGLLGGYREVTERF